MGRKPLPWLGSNDALPLATHMETRLPWRPTRGSLLEYTLKDQQRSSQTGEKMSHLIHFQRQIFIFLFSFPGCLVFCCCCLLLLDTLAFLQNSVVFFLTNKMKYVITGLRLGLCITKLCKSKFFLTFLPICLTFLTHIINPFYSLTPVP